MASAEASQLEIAPQEKEQSRRATPSFDVQDDVYVVNATEMNTELLAIRYSKDNKFIVTGGASGTIYTVLPTTHEIIGSYSHFKDSNENDPITCIREHPSPDQDSLHVISTAASGHIRCWDITKGELKYSLKEPRQCLGLAVSADNFITTGDDGVLYVYDNETNQLINKLEPSVDGTKADGHSTRAFAVTFHPTNRNEAISGGWDDSIHFWDVRKKQSIKRVGPTHICGSDALDFSANGKEILGGAYQKTNQLQMWEYETGNLLRTLETDRFNSSLYAAATLTDTLVCAGGADPPIFRAVHLQQKVTVGLVKEMYMGVTSLHKGPVGLKFPPRAKLNKGREPPDVKSNIPRVAFVAGKGLYEVEFY